LDGVPASLEAFVVAEYDGLIVGVAGIECYGGDALLRSVAVDATWRGTGLGAALVQRALAMAASRNVRTLWLLTTTADRWFPRFGFTVALREEVPAGVQRSREFQGACPASAIVMRRAV
jgi:amino-acid N-acetyltransferase